MTSLSDNLQNIVDELPEILTRDLDKNLCVCNEVTKIDVIKSIVEGADSTELVRQKTYATDGNGCCKRQVARLIEAIQAGKE